MKYMELLESEFLQDIDEIIEYMKETFDEFYLSLLTIESDGLIYNGDLVISDTIRKLKVQFKEVVGYFDCSYTNMTNLEGFPQSVGGSYFNCSNTNLTSLKFCPRLIGGDFYCSDTKITNPKEYRYALYSEIDGPFHSDITTIDDIINAYKGSAKRKYWPHAINLLSKVKL